MIRARGERRWYLVYHDEKEQLRISWPVTGGNSSESLMDGRRVFQVAMISEFTSSIAAKAADHHTRSRYLTCFQSRDIGTGSLQFHVPYRYFASNLVRAI